MAHWIRNNVWIFFFGIFALVGTVMGAVALSVWLRNDALMTGGVRTEGRVVALRYNGSSANAVIEYETDWGETQTWVSEVSSSPPAYEVGETVRLWYDPQDPGRVLLDGLDRWFLPALFGGFFVIFGGIGYGGMLAQWSRRRRKKWLLTNGTPVQANFTEVSRNSSLRVNGASPFVILCQWHDPVGNKVYTFQSDSIWFDPTPYLPGKTLQVMIDPRNPKSYHLDTSFLPESGN